MSKRLLFMTCYFLVLCLAASAQTELKAHYKLDETDGTVAADASGNGFDGTVSGTASWVEGTLNGALEFMGTDSVVLPANLMGMTSNTGSVAFWMNCINPLDTEPIGTTFWAGDNTTGGGFGGENEMHVHIERPEPSVWIGGELGFWVQGNPSAHIHSDPTKGTAGNVPVDPILMGDSAWHHVAATWGGGFIKLYIDGSLIMEAAYTPTGYPLTHIYLGQMANQGRTYVGMLDDVRIYSGVLFDFEIEDLYNKVTTTRDIENSNNLSFYPNPARDYLSVNFVSKAGKTADISLINLVGQEVTTKSVTTVTGINDITLNLDGLTAGIYFVRLELDNEVTIEKVRVK